MVVMSLMACIIIVRVVIEWLRNRLVLNDMPAVFDSVISATDEIFSDLGPVVAVDALLLEND